MRSTSRSLLVTSTIVALVALPASVSAGERPASAQDARAQDARAQDTRSEDPAPANERAAAAKGRDDASTERGRAATTGAHEDGGPNRHPSRRDRSAEPGGSGTQGKAKSDPDADTNGGQDQPGGAGGVYRADQDGNNGCGNDDDFEDDNNGKCLGRSSDGAQARSEDRPAREEDERGSAPARKDREEPAPGRDGDADRPARTDRPATGSEGGTAVTGVTPRDCPTAVTVTSTKDLSNVVLVFADGDHQRFEGSSGTEGTFAGTGDDAGETIVVVYVKSGANASAEGPGYGERHDVCVAGADSDRTTSVPTTSPARGSTSPRTGPVAVRDGERPAPGTIPGVGSDVLPGARPAVPAEGDRPEQVETDVLGVVIERRPDAAPVLGAPAAAAIIAAGQDVVPAAAPATAARPLPRTGTDPVPAVVAALLALGAGATAVRRSRTA